ncbi:uncharacterized protein LOC118477733 [Aplysia californica]|uniref:Uncharacterized protein LOC118477733 n=1 Tax=Aplysia californica TaxID=6500 RepID=A0ABM1VTT7_APLCA|nr:uncharacterized protein LOC118477733 [Aplysia californica]
MHTFGEHMDHLRSLCRFCGSKMSAKSAKPKDCSTYRDSIWTVYAVNIQDDVPSQHPSKMCQRCYRTMLGYLKKDVNDGMPAKRAREISWEPYNSECNQCSTCRMSQKKGIGGRRKKPDFSHNETFLFYNLSQDNIFSSLYDNSTVSFLPKMNKQEKCHFSLQSMPSSHKEKFECRLCSSFLTHHVVKTKCNHYFCAVCLSTIFKMSVSNSVPCPTCGMKNNFSEIESAESVLIEQLRNLRMMCNLCLHSVTYKEYVSHSCCLGESASSSQVNSNIISESDDSSFLSSSTAPDCDFLLTSTSVKKSYVDARISPFKVSPSASVESVVSPLYVDASTSPSYVDASTSPLYVDASTSPLYVDASTSPLYVDASTSPIYVDASTSPSYVDASTSPLYVDASTSPLYVDASTSPLYVDASTSPLYVDASTSPLKSDASVLLESMTERNLLKKSLLEPLNSSEQAIYTRLTKRKINTEDSDMLVCRTRGQPLCFTRFVKPRRKSPPATPQRSNKLAK